MLPKNKAAMMKGFDQFSARMAERYAQVRSHLDEGRFEEAQALLADMAMSHARTSLSLRNVLIKNGVIQETK